MSRRTRELAALSLLLVARLLIDGGDLITMPMRFIEELVPSIGGMIWPAHLVVAVLPLVGFVLAALLVAGGLPRMTMLVGVSIAIGASACGLAGVSFYGLVGWNIASGVITVGTTVFAASLVGGEPPTPRRFAALTAFLLLRSALRSPATYLFLTCFGADQRAAVPAYLVSLLAGLLAAAALVVATRLVVDRAPEAAARQPGVYRLGVTAEPSPPRFPFGLLALLLLPAIVLELSDDVTRVGDRPHTVEIFRLAFTAVAALYFIYSAARRLPLTPMTPLSGLLLATGVGVASWFAFFQLWEVEVVQTLAAIGQSILLAYVVLAARGRAAGLVVAVWVNALGVVRLVVDHSTIFGVGVAVATLATGALFIWRGRAFHSALEAARYPKSTSKFS